jgi:hypothetical protein
MMQKLLSSEPAPITYAAEPSAEQMAEDAEIAAFPIPVEAEDITIIRYQRCVRVGAARRPIESVR